MCCKRWYYLLVMLKQRSAATSTRFPAGVLLLLLQLMLGPGPMRQNQKDQRTQINISALRQLRRAVRDAHRRHAPCVSLSA